MAVRAPLLVHLNAHEHPLLECATQSGWRVASVGDAGVVSATLFVAMSEAESKQLRSLCPDALGVCSQHSGTASDLVVPVDAAVAPLTSVLTHALSVFELNEAARAAGNDIALRRHRTRQLTDIGIALSAERDPAKLLATILAEARRLGNCDAGSLYLIDDVDGERRLHFKVAQNDTVEVPVHESSVPLTAASLSGYVAVTGTELNVVDAYRIPATLPYAFNRSFDEQSHYRTRSMLVLPMVDHTGRVIGVLQFINALARDIDGATGIVPFDDEVIELLRAVASQAAVAIQKNDLLRQISRLFEGFVQASVKAIEQRDPSTSGHSARVAQTTTALFSALPHSGLARFRDLVISREHLTEVRYAALLHDFGKVGVREHVLIKANKLSEDRLEVIRYRIELQKERLRRAALEKELTQFHCSGADFELVRRRIKQELDRSLSRLDDYFAQIASANRPNVLPEGEFSHLERIHSYPFDELDGSSGQLITTDDVSALSVRRGSLTADERRQIESHVRHTQEFLEVLPWPPELARVPEIAGAHHEKLDGSGYPQGRRADEIPLPSRVMAVCDIFDALTAMDRPYKPAVSVDSAFRILNEEAAAGLIDADIVEIFIASGSYRRDEGDIGSLPQSARPATAHGAH